MLPACLDDDDEPGAPGLLRAAMSGGAIALLILAGWVVASFVLGLALRGPIQRRWLGGTGIVEWRRTAAELSWGDRWTLHWATSRGRVVAPRLARLAVRRAEMAIAVGDRMSMRRWPFRRLWLVWSGVLAVVAAFNLATAVFDAGSTPWWRVFLNVWLLVVLLVFPLLERRQHRARMRCVDLNRAQLDRDATGCS